MKNERQAHQVMVEQAERARRATPASKRPPTKPPESHPTDWLLLVLLVGLVAVLTWGGRG